MAAVPPQVRPGRGLRVPGVRGGGHRALPLQGRGLRDRLQDGGRGEGARAEPLPAGLHQPGPLRQGGARGAWLGGVLSGKLPLQQGDPLPLQMGEFLVSKNCPKTGLD